MMRAQLMELTPARRTRSRKAASLNIAFTRLWQSSKLPSMAMLWMAGEARVGSENAPPPPRGGGARAAPPAGIARGRPDDGHRLAACGQRPVHETGEKLHGHVLEGKSGAGGKLPQPVV